MNFVTQQMKPAVHQLVNKVERCILTHFLAQSITFDFLGRFMCSVATTFFTLTQSRTAWTERNKQHLELLLIFLSVVFPS